MARAGGRYIKEKDGSLTLVNSTQSAETKPIKTVKPTEKTPEVVNNEDA